MKAPEHKFPIPMDDCYAPTQWSSTMRPRLGWIKIVLASLGDSAGGNLAAAVMLRARDENGRHDRHFFPISAFIGGRPGTFGCDNRHQYRLNRFRCHEMTVSGRTMIRADSSSSKSPSAQSKTIDPDEAASDVYCLA
jgi:hypothetical protein